MDDRHGWLHFSNQWLVTYYYWTVVRNIRLFVL